MTDIVGLLGRGRGARAAGSRHEHAQEAEDQQLELFVVAPVDLGGRGGADAHLGNQRVEQALEGGPVPVVVLEREL